MNLSVDEMLELARKAYPEHEWTIEHFTSGPVCHRYGSPRLIFFDLEKHLADQMALQIALEKEGWFFGYKEDIGFIGTFDGKTYIDEHNAPTKPDLLLVIVREGV